ncbi:hypothetical protein DV451_001198 [Geotrichum candidum]|uniref:Uncharacterized protein n=1 Tax=Geotrichum candidum TaxID=1173061 RepID=A0A9P5KVY2_GEOCN|nr:hypothetical protein DV451_001198 [Geotrichum candidum]KAF5106994.1 hypothetical protein DV453_003484 [Geotrichum candidum]KAF5117442.1 hypothetical protein DV454_001111 [Geotrichum candidum]
MNSNTSRSTSVSSDKSPFSATSSSAITADTDVGQRLYRKCFYARINKQSQQSQAKSSQHGRYARRQNSPPKGAATTARRGGRRSRRDSESADSAGIDKSITPPPAEVASLGIDRLVTAQKQNA